MNKLTARKNYKGNLTLEDGDTRVGTIFLRADGSVSGGAFVDDEVASSFRRLWQMPIDTVENVLARCRRAYEIAQEP